MVSAMDIPTDPVLADGSTTTGYRSHRLEPNSSSVQGALLPDEVALRRRVQFVVGFSTLFGLLFIGVFAWFQPLNQLLGLRGATSVIVHALMVTPPVVGGPALMLWLFKRSAAALPTLRWDGRTARLQAGQDRVVKIPRAAMVGVQVAAARDRIGSSGNQSSADCTEVNLVYTEQHAATKAVQLTRVTLYRWTTTTDPKHQLAQELAKLLDTPLIDHATAEHRTAEKARAQSRPPRKGAFSG